MRDREGNSDQCILGFYSFFKKTIAKTFNHVSLLSLHSRHYGYPRNDPHCRTEIIQSAQGLSVPRSLELPHISQNNPTTSYSWLKT